MFYQEAFLRRRGSKFIGVLKYRDEAGVWRQRSKVLEATTKRKAERERDEWRNQMEREHEEREAFVAAADEAELELELVLVDNVADMVVKFINRLEASGSVEASTVRDYRHTAVLIHEAWGDVPAEKLSPARAQSGESALLARGLSPNTVGKVHRLAKQAYKDAVALELVSRNPFDAVRPPKRVKPKKNSLDSAGRTRLLEFLDTCELTPVVLAGRIALYTGMRRGEVCALTWRDVDFAQNIINVNKAIGEGEGDSANYVKGTKTDRVRVVPIPEALRRALEEARAMQAAMWQGSTEDIQSFYVLNGAPVPVLPNNITRSWTGIARLSRVKGEAGKPPTFHDLRHSFATAAAATGEIAPKTLQGILGHANISMTMEVYASVDREAVAKAGEVMNDAIRRPLAPVVSMVGREYAQTG